jgi:hypothetical protein
MLLEDVLEKSLKHSKKRPPREREHPQQGVFSLSNLPHSYVQRFGNEVQCEQHPVLPSSSF